MTLRHAVAYGLILGTTFSIGAAIADILYMRQLPRATVYYDPADFIKSLHKST